MMKIKITDMNFRIEGETINTINTSSYAEADAGITIPDARFEVNPSYGESYEVEYLAGTVTVEEVTHNITIDPGHEMGMLVFDVANENDMKLVYRNGKFYIHIDELNTRI